MAVSGAFPSPFEFVELDKFIPTCCPFASIFLNLALFVSSPIRREKLFTKLQKIYKRRSCTSSRLVRRYGLHVNHHFLFSLPNVWLSLASKPSTHWNHFSLSGSTACFPTFLPPTNQRKTCGVTLVAPWWPMRCFLYSSRIPQPDHHFSAVRPR